jgi:hypothetical protein
VGGHAAGNGAGTGAAVANEAAAGGAEAAKMVQAGDK